MPFTMNTLPNTTMSTRFAAAFAPVCLAALCLSACEKEATAPALPVEFTLEENTSPHDWATLDGEPPLVIAHRGASGRLPEHTIEAYERALDDGADAIEPDLVLTRDGVLVARHDRYLSTTTNVADQPQFADRQRPDPAPLADGEIEPRIDWWVEDFTLAELKTLKARQPREGRSQEFDDQLDIPTFEEVLVLATVRAQEDGRPVAIYPETKHPAFFASIGLDFETPLLTAIESYDAGLVFVQSFEPAILQRLRDQTTSQLVVLTDDAAAVSEQALNAMAPFADGIGVDKALVLDASGCATDLVKKAHALGLFVHAWTFRDDEARAFAPADAADCGGSGTAAQAELEAAFRAGVDGVFADFPDTAIAVRDTIEGD